MFSNRFRSATVRFGSKWFNHVLDRTVTYLFCARSCQPINASSLGSRSMPAVQPDPLDDRTPLMRAACSGNLCEVLELLLSGEAVDEQDSRYWTALSYACWQGEYEIAQQLLESGADPDVHESYSMVETPLSLAAERGDFDLVRLLIAHGADPNIYAGIAAVRAECYARWRGHQDISEFLRDHEDKRRKT